jgi:hypothetical protein
MTTFIDARAAALGITDPLSTDQRIALDLNSQVEKHQLAVLKLAAAVTSLGGFNAEEEMLFELQREVTQLHIIYDRHLYAAQGVDVTYVPSVVPQPPPTA